jgi:hypothetical protein
MTQNNNSVLMVVGLLAVVALIIYICNVNNKSNAETYSRKVETPKPVAITAPKNNIEKFTALSAGAINNVGMFFDDSYDLLPGADNGIPARHFADMVNIGEQQKEYVKQPKDLGNRMRPSDRMDQIQGASLMPRVSTYVTPYNIDVALPSSGSHSYMVGAPQVSTALKSKYKGYDLASMIRGDPPIKYHPNICLIAKTRLGRDDLRMDGFMSQATSALYNKYTGAAYKNLVQHNAGAGTASGYGGSSGGVIMDSY